MEQWKLNLIEAKGLLESRPAGIRKEAANDLSDNPIVKFLNENRNSLFAILLGAAGIGTIGSLFGGWRGGLGGALAGAGLGWLLQDSGATKHVGLDKGGDMVKNWVQRYFEKPVQKPKQEQKKQDKPQQAQQTASKQDYYDDFEYNPDTDEFYIPPHTQEQVPSPDENRETTPAAEGTNSYSPWYAKENTDFRRDLAAWNNSMAGSINNQRSLDIADRRKNLQNTMPRGLGTNAPTALGELLASKYRTR